MKFLHTSDWHLGRSLYGKKRYEEFAAFLDWLLNTITEQRISALLVAGDIFDTATPSNRAQELYYRFLCDIAKTSCRHVIIVAGNHDSPSFLNAPRELLRALNVHVVGAISDIIEEELIVLKQGNTPEAIICAVPYLRDSDIRNVTPGESAMDKDVRLVEGVRKHYSDICNLASQKKEELATSGFTNVPIIAMGHLFTAGGQTIDGDGVRELYIGSLAHVGKDIFPETIDYLALGHLHVPQKIGGANHLRYSGSPIPMGFGEAKQKKQVIAVEIKNQSSAIEEIEIPSFQELVQISGSLEQIQTEIARLQSEESGAWLEIEYTGNDLVPDLREQLDDLLAETRMEIRRIKNARVMDRILKQAAETESLDDLDEKEVFARCLAAYEIPEPDREDLIQSYNEIVKSIHEEDINAE